jgi:radical SAM protein with 4Fe4S-binding SPASM domain
MTNPMQCAQAAIAAPRTTSPCAYPWQQMIIDLTGEVVPCCFWSGYGNVGKPLGNTNESSVAEIWNGEAYQALRKANATGKLEGHPCHQCTAYAWSNGVYPPFSSPIPWRHESGWCYLMEIPERFAAEAGEALEEAELLEDGVALAHGKAVHDEIRQVGLGRYSVWGGSLYFSTSDNSDPSENGRRYELKLGERRVALAGLVVDSVSGRNILKAREEYVGGVEVMTAKPTMISLISTADCNIDCPGCSQNMVRLVKVQHRKGTVEDLLTYVPYLYQFIWHGGEPYLIKRFREFIDGFRTEDNPNLAFGFTSNGTMLTAKELEKLDKFPRINASISVDSFNKESFEKIRAGADFDKVLPNVLRAVAAYDAPDRVFSVGMVVCKSNFLELPANLDYAIEHDIGLNLSPVVIYPVTEQLNIFEDHEEQTKGWQKSLDEAMAIMRRAVAAKRTSVRRVDATGMLAELQTILDRARERYRDAVPLELVVEDPDNSLAQMARPGIIVYHQQSNEALAYCMLGQGPGRYTVQVPRGYAPKDIYWSLEHSVLEPFGRVLDGSFGHDRKRPWTERFEDSPVSPTHVRVPKFVALVRPRNIAFAAYGESTPEGLHVRRPEDIVAAYRKRVVDELIDDGRGDVTKRVEAGLQLQVNELREDLAAAKSAQREEREAAQTRMEALEANLRRSAEENSALAARIAESLAQLRASAEQIRRLGAELETARDDLQAGEAANRDLHAELESVRDELAANRELRKRLDVETERGRRTVARLQQSLAAQHTASLAVRLRRAARRFLGRTFRLVGPYAGDGGQCWVAPLGELAELADDADWQDSPLVVLENGAPLPLPHALHDDIRNLGGGRYSCWQGAVLFSTPDGSDPNRNGRRYTLALAPCAAQAAG